MHSAKESYEQIQALSDHRESLEHVWTHLLTEDKNILSQAQDEGVDEQTAHMLSSLKSSNDKSQQIVKNQSNNIKSLVLAEESDQSTSAKPLRNPQSCNDDVMMTEKINKMKISNPPKENAKAIHSGQVVQFSSELNENLNKQRKMTYQHDNQQKVIPTTNEKYTKSGKLKLRLVKTTIEQDNNQSEEGKTFAKIFNGSNKPLQGSDNINKNINIPSNQLPIPLQHSQTLGSTQKRRPFFKMSAGISRIRTLFSKSITDKGSGVIIVLLNAWRFASNLKKRSTSWSRNTVSPFQAELIDDIAQVHSLEAPGKWKKMRSLIQPTIHQQSSLTKESSLRSNTINSNSSNTTSSMLSNCQVRLFQWILQILESLPIINPQSQYLYVWDSIHLLFIVLTILVKPIELVTMTHMAEVYTNSILWSIFPMICLFVFSLDVVFNFNTGFYQCGMCIMERNQVMMNYLRKGVLWDILAILPILDSIFTIEGTWRIMNVFILFKYATMRGILAKYLELFQLQNEIVISTFIKLMKVGTLVLFQAHLFGCLFLGLAVLEDTYNLVDLNWIARYSKIQQTAQTPDQWLENRSVFSKYFYSFYWSVTTMTTTGYGDILPANNYEAIFTAFSMIIAGGVFAYSFNSIGIIVQEMDKRNQEFQHDLRLISKYLQNNNIKRSLQIEATKYIEYKHRAEKELSMKEEKEVLEKLGLNIGSKVTTSANIQLIKQIPFLVNNFSKKFLRKLALCFEKQTFLNNEIVFEEDDFKAPNSSYQFFQNQASNIPKGQMLQQQQLPIGQIQQHGISNSPKILASSSPKPGPIFASPGYKQFQPQHPSGFSGNLNTKKFSFSSQHIPIPQLSSQNQSFAGGNTTNHRNIQQQRQIPSCTPSVRAGAQVAQGFEGYIQQYQQQQQQQQSNMSQRINSLISQAVPNSNMNSNTQQFEDQYYQQQLNLNPSSSINSETSFYIVERGQIQLFTQSQKQINNDCIKPIKELKKADFFGELSFFSDKPRCCSARSIGASSVLSIKKKDFLKLLKEFPLDYEVFCQLRDEVSVNDDISSLQIHCHSCGALGHTSFKCSKVHFQPDRESVILKYRFNDKMKQLNRDSNYLRKNEKYNCLQNNRDVKNGQKRLKDMQIFVQTQESGGGSSRGILVTPCKQGSQRIISNKVIPPLPIGFNRDWCYQDQQIMQKGFGKTKKLQKLSTQPSIQEMHQRSYSNIHKQPLSSNNIYLVEDIINNQHNIYNNNDQDANLSPSRFKKDNMILEEDNERDSYKNHKLKVQWEQNNGINQLEQEIKQGNNNLRQSHFRKHHCSQSSIRVIDRVTSIGLINDQDNYNNNQLDLCNPNQIDKEGNQLNRINYLEDQENLGQNQKVSLNELAAVAGENLNESSSSSSSSSDSSQQDRKSRDAIRWLGQQQQQQQQQDIDQDSNSSDDQNSNQIQKQRLFPVKGKQLNNKIHSKNGITNKLKSSMFNRIDELKAIRRNLQHQSSLENRNTQKTLLLQHIQDTLKQLEDLEQGIVTSTEDQEEKEDLSQSHPRNVLQLDGIQYEEDGNILDNKKDQMKGQQQSKKDTIIDFPSLNTDRMKIFKQYFPLNNYDNVLRSQNQLKPHYFNRRNRIYHIYNRDTIKPMYQGIAVDMLRKQRTSERLTKIASAVINSNTLGQKNQNNITEGTNKIKDNNGSNISNNNNTNINAGVINPILQAFKHPQQNKLSFFARSSSKIKRATFSSDESF